MPIIGIREFKNRASEIIRKVQKDQDLYIVTCHGKPQTMIIPLREKEMEEILCSHHPYFLDRGKSRKSR